MERYRVYSLARRHINMDNAFAFAVSQGIELRHPLHDFRLTRFLMGASGDMLLRGESRKHLLREATRGILPEKIRLRTCKANISAPIIDAVSAHLRERPFRDMHCVTNGWVNAAELERTHAEYVAWRRSDGTRLPKLNYAAVWNTVATDMWLQYALTS
jgi:asparagine synthase (glutamine-hydrolysing)